MVISAIGVSTVIILSFVGGLPEGGAVVTTFDLMLGTSSRSIVLLSSVGCVVERTDVFRPSE